VRGSGTFDNALACLTSSASQHFSVLLLFTVSLLPMILFADVPNSWHAEMAHG
jgi:hypothetical protein